MKNHILNDLVLSVKKQNLQVLNVIVRQHGEIIARHDFEEEKPVLLTHILRRKIIIKDMAIKYG